MVSHLHNFSLWMESRYRQKKAKLYTSFSMFLYMWSLIKSRNFTFSFKETLCGFCLAHPKCQHHYSVAITKSRKGDLDTVLQFCDTRPGRQHSSPVPGAWGQVQLGCAAGRRHASLPGWNGARFQHAIQNSKQFKIV